MNFNFLYSDIKPTRLNEKDKEKLLDLIFKVKSNSDQKLFFFIKENMNLLFKNYANYIKNFNIKNKVLYLEVDSKFVFQEIQFLLPTINEILDSHLNVKITIIKELKKKNHY